MKLAFLSAGIALAFAQTVFAGCQSTNYINNCSFSSNIAGWTTTSGAASYDGTSGSSAPGSIQVIATGTTITFQQCVNVNALARPVAASFGIDHRDSAGNNIETVSVTVTDFSDTSCTSGNETGNSGSASDGLTSTSYRQISGSYTIGAAAQGVLFRVNAAPFAPTITGNFDDAFLGANVIPPPPLVANPGPTNNGLGTGGAIFFDLTALSTDLVVTEMTTGSTAGAGGTFTVEVFTRAGTALGGPVGSGPGSSSVGWTSLGTAAATQGGTANGVSLPINIPDIGLEAGQLTGVAVRFTGAGPRYRGTVAAPYGTYSDANLSVQTGEARSAPFTPTGLFFSPRELVGSLIYESDLIFKDGFQ
jgi:hypothetical protein